MEPSPFCPVIIKEEEDLDGNESVLIPKEESCSGDSDPDEQEENGGKEKIQSGGLKRDLAREGDDETPVVGDPEEPTVKKRRKNVSFTLEQMPDSSLRGKEKLFDKRTETLTSMSQSKKKEERRLGPAAIISLDEEEMLVKWLSYCSKRGLLNTDLFLSVQELLRAKNINNPFKDNMPGKTWYSDFIQRHPLLPTDGDANVRGASPKSWLKTISKILIEEEAEHILNDPSRVFNGDSILIDTRKWRACILNGTKGMRNDTKTNITVVCTFSANGTSVPPFITYPNLSKTSKMCMPRGYGFSISENGLITAEIFFKYIEQHFHQFLLKRNVQLPVILFVPCNKFLMTMQLSNMCASLQIILVGLYPKTFPQPCVVGALNTLKAIWKREKRTRQLLRKESFAHVFKKVFKVSVVKSTLKKAFKTCGIYPWNSNVLRQSSLQEIWTKKSEESIAETSSEANEAAQTNANCKLEQLCSLQESETRTSVENILEKSLKRTAATETNVECKLERQSSLQETETKQSIAAKDILEKSLKPKETIQTNVKCRLKQHGSLQDNRSRKSIGVKHILEKSFKAGKTTQTNAKSQFTQQSSLLENKTKKSVVVENTLQKPLKPNKTMPTNVKSQLTQSSLGKKTGKFIIVKHTPQKSLKPNETMQTNVKSQLTLSSLGKKTGKFIIVKHTPQKSLKANETMQNNVKSQLTQSSLVGNKTGNFFVVEHPSQESLQSNETMLTNVTSQIVQLSSLLENKTGNIYVVEHIPQQPLKPNENVLTNVESQLTKSSLSGNKTGNIFVVEHPSQQPLKPNETMQPNVKSQLSRQQNALLESKTKKSVMVEPTPKPQAVSPSVKSQFVQQNVTQYISKKTFEHLLGPEVMKAIKSNESKKLVKVEVLRSVFNAFGPADIKS